MVNSVKSVNAVLAINVIALRGWAPDVKNEVIITCVMCHLSHGIVVTICVVENIDLLLHYILLLLQYIDYFWGMGVRLCSINSFAFAVYGLRI